MSKPYTSRPLLLPNAKTWSDVFTDVAPWVDSKSVAPKGWEHSWKMFDESSRAKRKPLVDCPIGPFCSFRGMHNAGAPEHFACYVKAKPGVYDLVKSHTIHIPYDVMSFQVIVRDDGTALVTCDHSKIIGGSWVALIDASTIPEVKS